ERRCLYTNGVFGKQGNAYLRGSGFFLAAIRPCRQIGQIRKGIDFTSTTTNPAFVNNILTSPGVHCLTWPGSEKASLNLKVISLASLKKLSLGKSNTSFPPGLSIR